MDKDAIFMYFLYLILGIIALYFIVRILMNLDIILLNLLFCALVMAVILGAGAAYEKMIENGIPEPVAIFISLAIIILVQVLIIFLVPFIVPDRILVRWLNAKYD